MADLLAKASVMRLVGCPLQRSTKAEHSLRGRFWFDQRGATAIEFALAAGTLVFLILNGVDLGRYIYVRSQVENATQMGAHGIWKQCDPMKLPIVPKCYKDQAAAKAAVVNIIGAIVKGVTSEHVTVTEGYYCSDSAGALHAVVDVTKPPAQCLPGVVPGDYLQVQVGYSFNPIFGDLTAARIFGTSISTTSYMRLQ
ncbi:pilus assembly protein [Microvirga aerilata]|uniref:Pilus assembly protein n=1 Tax=Microvirga aerilata TaxID=670292 RepID=A0A936ZL73_9HYPH|nr:TadE/TadG family type IV pilus assembly protein [Microvirga aerilata]MBL0408080.1 pilus assembly protein [Microvirga aerilata]